MTNENRREANAMFSIVIDRMVKEMKLFKLGSQSTLQKTGGENNTGILTHFLKNTLFSPHSGLAGCQGVHTNIYSKDGGNIHVCLQTIQFCQAFTNICSQYGFVRK